MIAPMRALFPLAALLTLTASLTAGDIPKGWWAANTDDYIFGVETSDGPAAAFIQSVTPSPKSFIGLNQTFKADKFRGKRVRLKGEIKTQDVVKWAGFWLRADDAKSKIVAFDNMQTRGVSGSTNWTPGEIVLDIPEGASTMYLGLLLDGAGKAWMRNLSFEVVDESVPTTNVAKPPLPDHPVNLGFTE
jgi:hypothetical protein